MTLVSQIISDAYRESNITSLAGVPNDAQVDEGLRALQRIISSVYGNEAGDQLQPLPIGRETVETPGYPWDYPDDFFIPLNMRIILNLERTKTLPLHPNPQDGSRFAIQDENSVAQMTIEANGRKIDGLTSMTYDLGVNKQYIYRADIGQWVSINPIVLTGEMPFPVEFDDLFIISLAVRLDPKYTTTMAPESVSVLKDQLKKFKARYNQVIQIPSEMALLMTPNIRSQRGYWWNYGGYGNTTDIFNRGYPYYGGW